VRHVVPHYGIFKTALSCQGGMSTTSASATTPPRDVVNPPPASSTRDGSLAADTGNSILQQVAAQERRIAELQRQLEDRNTKLDRFQTAKKQEMEALLSGLKDWLAKIGLPSENDRNEVEKGLQRLVNNGADDNGIWRVMVTASSNSRQREVEYQELKIKYDELQSRSPAAPAPEFDCADARAGSKRAAEGEPVADSVGDLWGAFIADVSSTGYNNIM